MSLCKSLNHARIKSCIHIQRLFFEGLVVGICQFSDVVEVSFDEEKYSSSI
jgi:hypothetical protein